VAGVEIDADRAAAKVRSRSFDPVVDGDEGLPRHFVTNELQRNRRLRFQCRIADLMGVVERQSVEVDTVGCRQS
jgi:hypothetical protein